MEGRGCIPFERSEPLLAVVFALSRVLPYLAVTPVVGKVREGSFSPKVENGTAEVVQVRYFLPRKMGDVIPLDFVEDSELAVTAAAASMSRGGVDD